MRQQIQQKGYAASDIPELIFFFDEDKDGQLSFAEFHQLVSGMELAISEERLAKLFHTFDTNRNGHIDDIEFLSVLFPRAYYEMYDSLHCGDTGDTNTRATPPSSPRRRNSVTNVYAFRKPKPQEGIVVEQDSYCSEDGSFVSC